MKAPSPLLVACGTALGCAREAPQEVEPAPSAPDCNGFDTGTDDFDWDCCQQLIDHCYANAEDTESCYWICNG